MEMTDKRYDLAEDIRDCRLISKMTEYFSGDPKRIQHFLKVYSFAQTIGQLEDLIDERTYKTLCTAAIVHDIGIKPAEEKYGKGICGGKLQEELGSEPARKILYELGYDKKYIDRVCFLVAHHHTYTDVDGADWQILLEADFLVNAYEDNLSVEAIKTAKDKIFKTESGKKLLREMYNL